MGKTKTNQQKAEYKAVIFDFDYTLVDSSEGIILCFNDAMAKIGMEQVEPDVIKSQIGLSLTEMFSVITNVHDPEQIERFREYFKMEADLEMNERTQIYSMVPSVLMKLKRKGIKVGVVSNKFRYRILDFFVKKGLLSLVNVVIGGEDAQNPKPDPEGLKIAMDKLGCNPENCLYVGDSIVDAKTAQNAGVPFAAVLSGVTEYTAFSGYKSIAIMHSLEEVLGLIQ